MTQKVLVLGGGLQGSTIAEDLLEDGYDVTVADIKDPFTQLMKPEAKIYFDGDQKANFQFFDAEDIKKYPKIFGAYFKTFDVVVGALPAKYGASCVQTAVESGVNFIDLTFTATDLMQFDSVARENNCFVVADCGLAPGLSNLIIGDLLRKHQSIDEVKIYVGGISAKQDKNKYGYVRTWSLSDLCQEYIRESRILENGKEKILAAPISQNSTEILHVPTVGDLEAFYSDGVRSLLHLKDEIPTIIEKTLRWPGHLKEIQNLITPIKKNEFSVGPFFKEFENKIPVGTDDLVVMVVEGAGEKYTLIDYGVLNKSAMTRTTAYSCGAFAKLALKGWLTGITGVHFPEQIGRSNSCYEFIIKQMEKRGVKINVE